VGHGVSHMRESVGVVVVVASEGRKNVQEISRMLTARRVRCPKGR